MGEGVRLREAVSADWGAIAALQTATWRFAYRGILSDTYLDDELPDDRRMLWRSRFEGAIAPEQITVLAEPAEGGAPLAFACILGGYDRWGSLVDNLHVHPDALRQGLGRRVLREAAALMVDGPFAAMPVHLTVYEQNTRAIAAYESYGGRLVERPTKRQPDGGTYDLRRYLWDSPAALVARLDPSCPWARPRPEPPPAAGPPQGQPRAAQGRD
jgi:ribosomal protein S18 acetylase RimI-like enzyme